jgi:hypothetical protein
MRPRILGFFLTVIVLALAGGAVLLKQREQTYRLQGELEAARDAADELKRLRSENARLLQKQIPAAELESLRADHAALARLRAETETMGKAK